MIRHENLLNGFARTIIVTGDNAWVTVKAFGIFYQTLTGDWRVLLNIYGTMNNAVTTTAVIAGITFANYTQTGTVSDGSINIGAARALGGNGTISLLSNVASTTRNLNGDFALASKPTMYLGE